MQQDYEGGIPGKASSNWVILAQHESTLGQLVHQGNWEQWKSKTGWAASQAALRTLSAFPDADGRLPAEAAVCLSLLEHLRAPWRRLKVRPDVGFWTDDYSNLLRVFDWKN
jgi:hypothetical protein